MTNNKHRLLTSMVIFIVLFIPIFILPKLDLVFVYVIALFTGLEWIALAKKTSASLLLTSGFLLYIITALFGLKSALNNSELNLFLPQFFASPLVSLLVISSLSDTSAYFVGSIVKGPKIAPSISPNKTLSGSLAGLILPVIIISMLYPNSNTKTTFILVSLCLAAELGDLIESWIKRKLNVKDSGSLLPGHGGFLDRFDSLLGIGVTVSMFGILKCFLIAI